VAAIGITNQRETVIVWERATGKAIHPAIVWQDRRTARKCAELWRRAELGRRSREDRAGAGPVFFGDQGGVDSGQCAGRAGAGRARRAGFGTVDSWLIWHLTSGQRHVTDVTNASRTLLFNIVKGEWDEELLRIFGIPESMLPEVVWSSERWAR
jgi:glycerol kinase